MSSDHPDGRQIFLFGWMPNDPTPGVWKSRLGIDVEIGALRAITSEGFDRECDLTERGTFSISWWRNGTSMAVRFRLT